MLQSAVCSLFPKNQIFFHNFFTVVCYVFSSLTFQISLRAESARWKKNRISTELFIVGKILDRETLGTAPSLLEACVNFKKQGLEIKDKVSRQGLKVTRIMVSRYKDPYSQLARIPELLLFPPLLSDPPEEPSGVPPPPPPLDGCAAEVPPGVEDAAVEDVASWVPKMTSISSSPTASLYLLLARFFTNLSQKFIGNDLETNTRIVFIQVFKIQFWL